MDSNEKIIPQNLESRRKFVWGVGILSVFAAIAAATGLPFRNKKHSNFGKLDNKKGTVKMLTQDGRLVEIDQSLLAAGKKKVTNSELQHWIKK
ncbi:MAG: hypothetical protein ACXVB0_06325 [Mucilaginibacter sp.]